MGEFVMGGRRVLPSDLESSNSSLSKVRRTAEKLGKGRDDLLTTFSRLEMVADLLTSNGVKNNLNKLSNKAGEAEKKLIESKLHSLDRIMDFMSSEITQTMKKVRDNQKVTGEESAALVDTISRLSDDLKLLEKSEVISRRDIHKTQMKHMKSGSATNSFKGDILSRFLVDMMSTGGMHGGTSSKRMMKMLGLGGMNQGEMQDFFNTSSGQRYMKKRVKSGGSDLTQVMEQMINELDDLAEVNSKVATAMEIEGLEDSNSELSESLRDLSIKLREMPQFIEENEKLQFMLDDLTRGANVDRTLLRSLLTDLDTDTTPEKTLYSLDRINSTMDDMLVSTDTINDSIKSGVLGSFREQASKFTGKPALKDGMMAVLANSLGINPALLEGAMDLGGTAFGAAATLYGAKKLGGKGEGGSSDAARGKKGKGGKFRGSFSKAGELFSGKIPSMAAIGKGAGRALKFLPVIGQVAAAAMALFDIFDGWTNAGSILGKAEEELTTLDRFRAAGASLLSGLTLGLVDVQSCLGFIDDVGATFGKVWSKTKSFFGEMTGKLAAIIPEFLKSIVDMVGDLLPDSMKSGWNSLTSGASSLASSASDSAGTAWQLGKNFFSGINNTTVGKLKDTSERENNLMKYAQSQGIRGDDLAQFMGQTAVESGYFKDADLTENGRKEYFDKYNAGTKIGKNLGNTQEGDGFKYRGRGYIQLTGRDNYKRYGDKIGVDLINNPDLAAQPEIAEKIAVAYYQDRVGTGKTTVEATKKINGGDNHLAQREEMYQKYSRQIAAAQAEVESASSATYNPGNLSNPLGSSGSGAASGGPLSVQSTTQVPMLSTSHPMELLGINGGFLNN